MLALGWKVPNLGLELEDSYNIGPASKCPWHQLSCPWKIAIVALPAAAIDVPSCGKFYADHQVFGLGVHAYFGRCQNSDVLLL